MESRPFERWCRDRRSTGERPLTPEERARLEGSRRRIGWSLTWPWAGFLLYWAVLLAFAVAAIDAADWVRGIWMFLSMIGLLLLLPVAILMTRDQWDAYDAVRRDLHANRIERFEPVVTGASEDIEGIIEVRLPSVRILTGPPEDVGDPCVVREVAPGPIVGLRVAHPAEGLPEGARLERRHLAPEERDELERAIRKVEKLPWREYVGALWCALCVWGWVGAKKPLPFTAYLVLAQGLFCGGWFLWVVYRNHVLVRRMRADVEDGFALVFVPPDADPAAEEEGLPHSGLSWRVAGLPAEWRGGDLLGYGER